MSRFIPPPFVVPAAWSLSTRISGPYGRQPRGMTRFGCVSEGCVYRSGLPTREGWQIVGQHFQSVLSLCKEFADPGDIKNLRYLRVPIEDETAPTKEQGHLIAKYMLDPSNWPMLVHCEAGSGRTSTACAIARYSFDGWPMHKALREVMLYRPGVWKIRLPLCAAQDDFLHQWRMDNASGGLLPRGATLLGGG